jgi:hypothetical protein
MPVSTQDLGKLFGAALTAVSSNQQALNKLDGHNGNHGDNMAKNLQLIVQALQSQKSKPPAAALQQAAKALQTRGVGGSGRDYAAGLSQAAREVSGRSNLGSEDVVALLQTIMASVPDQGSSTRPGQPAAGNVLDSLLGSSSAGRASDGQLDAGDLVSAGMAFLQAKQSGADDMTAIVKAAMSALGGQGNPLQLGSARAASGGLIAQSVLQSLLGRR